MNAQTELNKIDWSASTNDFRLAEAVLQDRFEDAALIMLRIGQTGEMITEACYHTWPLFKAFRETSQFINTYEKIYSHPFVAELKRSANETLTIAASKEGAN